MLENVNGYLNHRLTDIREANLTRNRPRTLRACPRVARRRKQALSAGSRPPRILSGINRQRRATLTRPTATRFRAQLTFYRPNLPTLVSKGVQTCQVSPTHLCKGLTAPLSTALSTPPTPPHPLEKLI